MKCPRCQSPELHPTMIEEYLPAMGCGTCKGGQHLRYPDRTPIANLLLTLLDRAGVPAERVGDSTGRFTEL